MRVEIKKLDPSAIIPSYAHYNDACMDITAISVEYDHTLDCYIYHTGLSVAIPDGYEMQIRPRSSNRKTNAYLCNHVGTIDSGYRGELLICYKNRDSISTNMSNNSVYFQTIGNIISYANEIAPYKVGDKIAQLIIMPYPKIEWDEVEELSEGVRGDNGFGSTDKK